MPDDPKSVLDDLDRQFDDLRKQYELFFSGGRKTDPGRERAGYENTIRKLGQRTLTSTQDQFRFNAIQARYYSFANHWIRTLRDLEEGRLARDARGALSRSAPQAANPIDPADLDQAARRLAEARVECGLPAASMSDLAGLKEALLSRARDIAARSQGNGKVEFRISVEEGKPKIRAILK